jgi:hypothetical protein
LEWKVFGKCPMACHPHAKTSWRRFLHVLGKLGYAQQKGKAGSAGSFRNSTRNPNVVTNPGQNVRQTMLHEYPRKLLLSPDEFMRLLEDC